MSVTSIFPVFSQPILILPFLISTGISAGFDAVDVVFVLGKTLSSASTTFNALSTSILFELYQNR